MSSLAKTFTPQKYRADIDGLRAIAVLSVVLFHAFPKLLTGGFTGVDVFFVISGFLISSIIFENSYNNKFNFIEFYSRRIKRIFPALITVLISSYILAWFILLDTEFKQLGFHIFGGASFTSNLILWNEASYFDTSADSKPLLHLWSLGIEEQFYIFWPLLIVFFNKNKNIYIPILIIILASFIYNFLNIKIDPTATFYSLFTRLWELASGGLLAWLLITNNNNKNNYSIDNQKFNQLNNLLSIIGLILLIYSFYRINNNLSFPGKWAIIPVLGSILIIYSGPNALINKYILSNKFLVWIGLISFPLYLWHWPLITFTRILYSNQVDPQLMIGVLFLSTFLAWFTYRFIEKPIRHSSLKLSKILFILFILLLVGIVGYTTYLLNGIPARNVHYHNQALIGHTKISSDENFVNGCGISKPEEMSVFEVCGHDKRGNVKYAIMGDSKAYALYQGLVRTSSSQARWLMIGGTSIHGAPIPMLTNSDNTSIALTVVASNAIAQNSEIETVVLVTSIRGLFQLKDGTNLETEKNYNHFYLENLPLVSAKVYENTQTALTFTVEKFIKAGKKVVIVVDNPVLPHPYDCVGRKTSFEFFNQFLPQQNPACFVPLSRFESQISGYKKMLNNIKQAHLKYVEIFDATDIYCNRQTDVCGPLLNNKLLYNHTDHISDYAGGLVGQKLNDFLSKSP